MPMSDSDSSDAGFAFQLRTDDVIQALAKRNPGAPRGDLERAGRAVTLISKAVLNDAAVIRHIAGLSDAATSDVLEEIASGLGARSGMRRPPSDEPGRAEGAGLGEIVGREIGMASLADYASSASLEDWAGPVADADDVMEAEGVTPETLDAWRLSRAVIELPDRGHRSVFPSGQFADHRPVPGLAEVQAIVGDPRTAWLWLVETGDDGAPSWLDLLRRGDAAQVLEGARQDFR